MTKSVNMTTNNHEVSIEEVRHMAKLSRLKISHEEEIIFARQFAQILNHMDVLQKIDTSGLEPLYSPVHMPEETRPDIANNRRTVQEILANAPETDGKFFIVPRIV